MKKNVVYIIMLLFLLKANLNIAQPSGKIYEIESEEVNKPKILTLFQNKAGLIFCGTSKGLYRFDGFEFYRYSTIVENPTPITALFETKDKKLWIGFENGNIGVLDHNKIILQHFEEGFPKQAIKSIIQDDEGNVWIATAGEGIYYLSQGRLYNINQDDGLSDNYVYKLALVPSLGVVAATDKGINICNIKNKAKSIRNYSFKDGLPDNIVRCIYAAPDNKLWLGMQDAGITTFSNSGNIKQVFKKWAFGQVNDIVADKNDVYIATEDSALIRIPDDINSSAQPAYTIDRRLNQINCLLKDREGNIWAAGDNQLLRTGKTEIEKLFALKKEYADKVHCLYLCSDDYLWFNTFGGAASMKRMNGQWDIKNYPLKGMKESTITSVYEDNRDENIWIGTLGNGVVIFNELTGMQHVIKENPLLVNSNVISITGKDDNVWIASLEGVVKATVINSKISYINYTDTSIIGSKYVYHIFTDSKNRVWFATDGNGLILLDNGKFTALNKLKGYIGNVVYKVTEDNAGNIWYTTYDKGLVKFNGTTFTAYSTEQGLSDAEITGLQNAGGNLLILHKSGLDLFSPVTGKISYPEKPQDTFNINTDLNASTKDDKGNVYFIASGNVYRYHSNLSAVLQPSVLIDRVQVLMKDADPINGITFPYNKNNISFFYTGLFYSQPEKILYQYKLENYSKEWKSTRDRLQNFPKLPPGNYTFKVRVSLNSDFTNAKEASINFTIEKPFWLQPWFVAVAIAVFSVLFYLFLKQRDKRVQYLNNLEKDKIRSQLQTLRTQIDPHFLFNSFNTLIAEIENHPDDAVVYVERLSDFYRSIVMQRDKDLISLEEELTLVKDYCFLQQKRYNTGLSLQINISEEQVKNFVVAPFALQLLAENAIKHNAVSKEMPLTIELSIQGDGYLMARNNINPKIQTAKDSGMGLQNIQQRYSLLCNKPVLIEHNNQYFTVLIPLIKNMI